MRARPIRRGLKFFADLNKSGNFVPVIGKAASLAQGTTPIIVRWDYNALADRDTLKGNPKVQVVVPKTGVVAGVYVQAISAYAPHPNAAKLWMEYLYSDEGQIGWLTGYCHPIRYNELVAAKKVPQALLDKLPPRIGLQERGVPDAVATGRVQGHHHQALGRSGRREREMTCCAARSGRRSGRRPTPWSCHADHGAGGCPRTRSPSWPGSCATAASGTGRGGNCSGTASRT